MLSVQVGISGLRGSHSSRYMYALWTIIFLCDILKKDTITKTFMFIVLNDSFQLEEIIRLP